MQHFLKALARAARARIVAPELFEEFFIPMNDSNATLHVRLGWIASTTLTGALESRVGQSLRFAWNTSGVKLLLPDNG
jgi:hypothetical protein